MEQDLCHDHNNKNMTADDGVHDIVENIGFRPRDTIKHCETGPNNHIDNDDDADGLERWMV